MKFALQFSLRFSFFIIHLDIRHINIVQCKLKIDWHFRFVSISKGEVSLHSIVNLSYKFKAYILSFTALLDIIFFPLEITLFLWALASSLCGLCNLMISDAYVRENNSQILNKSYIDSVQIYYCKFWTLIDLACTEFFVEAWVRDFFNFQTVSQPWILHTSSIKNDIVVGKRGQRLSIRHSIRIWRNRPQPVLHSKVIPNIWSWVVLDVAPALCIRGRVSRQR